MDQPLATLKRHSRVVHLQHRVAAPADEANESEQLRFSDLEDAERYLRFWMSDGAAMDQLRFALHASGHSGIVAHRSDHEVVRALAARLLSHSLVMVEEGPPLKPLTINWELESAAAPPEPPPPAVVIRPKKKPVPTLYEPPLPPLLPLLEEVQIEGAEVLPEVMQTLEQIDLTMGTLDLADLSLEPTPSGVPPISERMLKASTDVTDTIDAL